MPRWRSLPLLILLFLALTLASPVRAMPPQQDTPPPPTPTANPRLECTLEPEQTSVGQKFVLTVFAWDVEDLYAYQFDLKYDTNLVKAVDADPQREGVNAVLKDFLKPDLVIYNEADDNTGLVSIGASESFPADPVRGSGPLAQVQFEAIDGGEAAFTFENITLADPDAQLLPADSTNCVLEITGEGTPTPTTEIQPTEGTPLPSGASTSIARILASLAPTGTPGQGTPSAIPAATATPAASSSGGGFFKSLVAGFGLVIGLAAVVLAVLWWRSR